MKNAVYWIALQDILGYGAKEVVEILENFDDVKDVFDKSTKRKDLFFISDEKYKKIVNYNFKKSKAIVDYCDKKDIQIITIDDDIYPIILKRIRNAPAVLYCRGTFPDFDNEVGIAMIGTRNATMNGMIVAATLAFRMAQAGAIVISGGANGIDTKCTQGAIYAKKPTVIVRPCGLDYDYLGNLSHIRKTVENCGAVISEIQPLGKVERNAFQIRNRIIAALAHGVVAIEVPEKSGVLITVGYALEFGKDIFSVPGDIGSENHIGSNKLLQDGAIPVYNAYDVLNEYLFSFPHKLKLDNAGIPINEDDIYLRLHMKYSKKAIPKDKTEKIEEKTVASTKKSIVSVVKNKFSKDNKKQKVENNNSKSYKKELSYDADDNVRLVFKCLLDSPCSLEYIIEKTKLSPANVMYALSDLEINDEIIALPGGRYEIKY